MHYTISVIIPNYCHAEFLDQRIQSVLNQTYDDFEVIILDDCSPDNGDSKKVIERYRDNAHVTQIIYNEQNSGSTFIQWQKGFEVASGDIIWIAESDDYCAPDFLKRLMLAWQEHPECSIAQCTSCHVGRQGELLYPNIHYSNRVDFYDGKDFIKRKLLKSCFAIPNASAVIFKKKIAQELPKDYMNYKSSGDRLFWIYMCERGGVCHIDSPLNFFRHHGNKVSSKKELDGTQCRENYRINQYMHRQGYVKGLLKLEEYKYYREYIMKYHFATEDIRKELTRLWFPAFWQKSPVTLFLAKACSRVMRMLKIYPC